MDKITEQHVRTLGQNVLYFERMAARRPECAWFLIAGEAHHELFHLYQQLGNEISSLIWEDEESTSARVQELDRLQTLASVYLHGKEPARKEGREYIGVRKHKGAYWCQRRWMTGRSPSHSDEQLSKAKAFPKAQSQTHLVKILRGEEHKTQEIWCEGEYWWKVA